MDLWRRLISGTSRPPSPSGPGGPLEGIDTIDWAHLEHAYGPAADVPGQLHDVAVGSSRKRRKAMWELWGNIHHQGTVYAASAPAVPFIAKLAQDHDVPAETRAELVRLLAELAVGTSYLDVHEWMMSGGLSDDQRAARDVELANVRATHDAVAAAAPDLLRDIGSGTDEMMIASLQLAANVPEAARSVSRRLLELRAAATTPERRVAIGLTLALIDGSESFDQLKQAAHALGGDADMIDPTEWPTPSEATRAMISTLLDQRARS